MSAPATCGPRGTTRAALLDEAQVNALKSVADREPSNAQPRVATRQSVFRRRALRRCNQVVHGEATKLAPNDVNLSTDLGVCYYYTNQPDKALEQFAHSLKIDPNHLKTLLNLGIVRAFGKQDLDGAAQAWQQVLQLSPDSPEGQAAKRALDSFKSRASGIGGSSRQAWCLMLRRRLELLLILFIARGHSGA